MHCPFHESYDHFYLGSVNNVLNAQLEKFLFNSGVSSLDVSQMADVTDQEKIQMLASATWDIDFVAVTGDMNSILTDSQVAQLIGNCSGKLLTCCSLQNVRTDSFGRMLMFTKLGDWMLGNHTLFLGEPLKPLNSTIIDEEHEGAQIHTKTEVFFLI